MREVDFEKLQAELGISGFARRLTEDPALQAAFAAYRREQDEQRQALVAAVEAEADGVWKVSREGRDHPIVAVPLRRRHVVRAVGELVIVSRHWTDSGPKMCFGPKCPHCPSERRREGYFDAITVRESREGIREPYRCIQAVPNAAVMALEDAPLRGIKVELYRQTPRSKTSVRVIEESCSRELPPAIDIRVPLMRLWNVPSWPGEAAAASDAPAILPFRKQA